MSEHTDLNGTDLNGTDPKGTDPQGVRTKHSDPRRTDPQGACPRGAGPRPPVRQLRLVVEAADYDAAVRFYRDALGLTEEESFEDPGEGEARGMVLDAGRATLELHNPAQRRMIDGLETDGIPSGHIRVAFEVVDAAETTQALTDAGAALIAAPRVTPWQSLNSRLEAPAGLTVTLFQELAAGERTPTDLEGSDYEI
ncbi:VOC family protein [Cryobacterium sp. TMT1-2-1]|uniref:VOC family protein n=1 Tax=Cryobacterium sp. TMT1-2-1 TaxID=1259232 RepID=UPI00106AD660|nr:VOC family protein [Cryobacterium sp. TMT1-2-1]TFD46634.1 VOC family protein [Cryobacterium sp. TMT1-2-1]